MRVLLVEDNPNKRNAIVDFYESAFPEDDLATADSLIGGLRLARDLRPNIVLLDMSLPSRTAAALGASASTTQAFAGKEFLWRVKRMNFKTQVILVSMFETFGVSPNITTLTDLDNEMRERYPNLYVSFVHYSPSDDRWQTEIADLRKKMEEI